MNQMLTRLGRAFLAAMLLLVVGGAAVVAAADIGHKDFVASGSAITGSKPESKVWFNDGVWWASMWSTSPAGFYIYKLDTNSETWSRTSTALDPRSGTRADTIWDGTKLYVASQKWSADGGATTSGTAGETRLYQFSYNNGNQTYTLDSGFPASMRTNIQSETLVIAKDSTGMLWATWTQKSGSSNLVYTNHTVNNNDASWSSPQILPVGTQSVGVTTDLDDISTIIAFTVGGQHRIGVLWSNQADVKDYFAWRVDGTPDTTVWTAETAISATSGNPLPADDHLNMKVDAGGHIFAVAKASNSTSSARPLIELLDRTSTGTWSQHTVGIGTDSNTRAILELDESAGKLHVFMTGPHNGSGSGQSGGDIYEKVSNTSSISFSTGLGTAVIRDSAASGLNDVTSTKQNISSATGVVALAFQDKTDKAYWHHHDTLGGGPPQDPQAAFTQDNTSGTQPLTVAFTNQSTGTPTLTYAWDFGDPSSGGNNTSTQTNPSHIYNNAGTYTVKLTTTNGNSQSNTVTQTGLITVSAPSSSITLTPDADAQVKSDSATTNYGTLASVRTRDGSVAGGSTYRTFLRFNVTGLTGSITGVKLRLFASDASTDVQSVWATQTNPNWIESGTGSITYTNAPVIGSTLLGSGSVPTLGAYNEITLSPSAVSGNGLVTFAMTSAGSNSAIFNSKEAAVPVNAPQLVITQSIAPANTPPTASPTSTSTAEDTAATVALSATDPETCDLGFEIVTPPSHGSLSSIGGAPCVGGSPNNDSASVTYTPAANYSGPDSFSYRATDPTDPSAPATATITVTPVNDPPIAKPASASTTVDTGVAVTLSGSDVDNCELTFTITNPPSHGTLGSIADNTCVVGSPNTDSATVTYTPAASYTGPDSFSYKVNDGSADSLSDGTATITVTAVNTSPTANDTSKTTNEDTAANVALSGGDAETCELTFSLVTVPTKGTVNFAGQTPAACAGTGPYTDSATVTYTPNANANGSDSFTYRVNDGATNSAPATASITITPVNDAASANNVTTSTGQNVAKTITLSGSDIETCDLTFAFSQPSHGSVGSLSNNACAGGSPNTDSSSVLYTPTNGYSGPDSFTYTVDDGSGPSAAATVSITVTGGSPTTITLNPVADAHINSATANVTKNYGTLNPIRTREDPATPNSYRPYFQFNVPALSGSVSSVKLRVFVTTGSSSVTQSVYLVGNGWTETGVNWSNAPVPSGSAIGSAVAATSGAYVEFTLTTPVTANSTISFALVSSGTSSVYFSTREDATNKPQLVIVSGP